MSIVRCTAYPFRYAEEAYAESADEADALELFDSSLYTGMFSIDFDTRRAGRPCLDGAGRKRNLAQQIGKAWQARPVYCRKTGAYEVGGWNVAGANCGHESAVFSPPFPWRTGNACSRYWTHCGRTAFYPWMASPST